MSELLMLTQCFLSTAYFLAATWQYATNEKWHFQAFSALFFLLAGMS